MVAFMSLPQVGVTEDPVIHSWWRGVWPQHVGCGICNALRQRTCQWGRAIFFFLGSASHTCDLHRFSDNEKVPTHPMRPCTAMRTLLDYYP